MHDTSRGSATGSDRPLCRWPPHATNTTRTNARHELKGHAYTATVCVLIQQISPGGATY